MIYFVQETDGSPVKIGFTKSLGDRKHGLLGYGFAKLQVLGVMDGERKEERSLHLRFAHLKVFGEWFHPEPELLDFIAQNASRWVSDAITVKPIQRSDCPQVPPQSGVYGPVLAENLARLGYARSTVNHRRVAELVRLKTGKFWSRQQIGAILNSVRVSDETIKTLADAVGVTPKELLTKH